MGLDIWFSKLKDNSKWDATCGNCLYYEKHGRLAEDKDCEVCPDQCAWFNVEENDLDKHVPNSNYYYKRGFENPNDELYLIDDMGTLLDMESKITGDPCCSREQFSNIITLLNKFNNNVLEGMTEKELGILYEGFSITNVERIRHFIEYMNIAYKQGYIMWFSY